MAKERINDGSVGMNQVRRFIPAAKISAVALLVTSASVACIEGVEPFVIVSRNIRGLITLGWLWNVGAFLVCGGMVLGMAC